MYGRSSYLIRAHSFQHGKLLLITRFRYLYNIAESYEADEGKVLAGFLEWAVRASTVPVSHHVPKWLVRDGRLQWSYWSPAEECRGFTRFEEIGHERGDHHHHRHSECGPRSQYNLISA